MNVIKFHPLTTQPSASTAPPSWEGYDVIHEGRSHGMDPTRPANPEVWAQSGATWWLEGAWDLERIESGHAELLRRIQAGPPGQTT